MITFIHVQNPSATTAVVLMTKTADASTRDNLTPAEQNEDSTQNE